VTRPAALAREQIGHHADVTLNPPAQYADDRNLRARQRLWQHQSPYLDIVGWVLDLAGVARGLRVLDVGCGNGTYLQALRARHVAAVGLDLSPGMLRSAGHREVVNADVVALPVRDASFDIVLAPHMLYHVADRAQAIRELRRVLIPGGRLVAVTNGAQHLRSLRDAIELAAGGGQPGWRLPSPATDGFSAANAADQLGTAFGLVTCVRPDVTAPVIITDAGVAADYVASLAALYADVAPRPWPDIVADVRRAVQRVIDEQGAFRISGDPAAFVCRP
jgi:SAM-dependent methyltransferase